MECVSGATTPISGDSIRVHLEKILASPRFANSGRLTRFLRFSVEEALAGRAENLKEYTLALEVFDKAASHDPGADPIVRVEARRLRARLKEYYETEGRGDSIRIDIPKGAYIPIFQRVASPALPWRSITLGIATAVLIAVLLAWWRHFRETPHELALKRLSYIAGLTTQPALSPDGRLLAYASDRGGGGDLEIWVQPITGGDPLRLTHIPADDHEPAFSPDSTRIAFRSERNGGGVFIVPAQGGEVRQLAEHGRNPRFSPDGNWVAYWVGSGAAICCLPQPGRSSWFRQPAEHRVRFNRSSLQPSTQCGRRTANTFCSRPYWSPIRQLTARLTGGVPRLRAAKLKKPESVNCYSARDCPCFPTPGRQCGMATHFYSLRAGAIRRISGRSTSPSGRDV